MRTEDEIREKLRVFLRERNAVIEEKHRGNIDDLIRVLRWVLS